MLRMIWVSSKYVRILLQNQLQITNETVFAIAHVLDFLNLQDYLNILHWRVAFLEGLNGMFETKC